MAGFKFNHEPIKVQEINTKYRTIKTKIPTPESSKILEKAYKLESRSMHGQIPIVWDKAKDFQVYDAQGNCWIDFTSTIFVTNAGHGNSRITQAVENILKKPLLHTYTYMSEARYEYLKLLIEKTPANFEKVFMVSAGTEATECALKLMRENAIKIGKKKRGIICIEGNWHGRTMGAQMMGWNPDQKSWIGYHDPNIYHIQFPYPWRRNAIENPRQFFKDSIAALCEKNNIDPYHDICGFMLETFQGWGAFFYPNEYIQALSEFAEEHNILVTFDEMQSGFGRTGKLFGYMHYDIEPDLLCCGKGASSGFPLALVLGSSELLDLPSVGSMSSTHSANPIVCAAGKANLECLYIDGLLDKSRIMGDKFHEKLQDMANSFPSHIQSVQGKGLLAAIIFKDKNDEPLIDLCNRVSELCMQRGLLVVHTGRESIKLAPPFTINEEALSEGITVLRQSISEVIGAYQS